MGGGFGGDYLGRLVLLLRADDECTGMLLGGKSFHSFPSPEIYLRMSCYIPRGNILTHNDHLVRLSVNYISICYATCVKASSLS